MHSRTNAMQPQVVCSVMFMFADVIIISFSRQSTDPPTRPPIHRHLDRKHTHTKTVDCARARISRVLIRVAACGASDDGLVREPLSKIIVLRNAQQHIPYRDDFVEVFAEKKNIKRRLAAPVFAANEDTKTCSDGVGAEQTSCTRRYILLLNLTQHHWRRRFIVFHYTKRVHITLNTHTHYTYIIYMLYKVHARSKVPVRRGGKIVQWVRCGWWGVEQTGVVYVYGPAEYNRVPGSVNKPQP